MFLHFFTFSVFTFLNFVFYCFACVFVWKLPCWPEGHAGEGGSYTATRRKHNVKEHSAASASHCDCSYADLASETRAVVA